MHDSILNKPIVLALNAAWQVIGHRTVKEALTALAGGDRDHPPARGLDILYPQRADGSFDFDQPAFCDVGWPAWLELPVRDFDLFVRTANRPIRAPTVIVATHYAKMPLKAPRLTREAIFRRDGGVCQYSGEYVGLAGGNLDHVNPRHRGGIDSFENLVWAKREINSRKGGRLPHEAGLRLRRIPRAPQPLPACATVTEIRHPDWKHFIRS